MEEYADINGLKVFTRIKGEGSPFLILHGWGSSVHNWTNMQDLLSEKFKTYILDMPGFGKTAPPDKSWCLDDYLVLILKYCEHYKLDKFYLLGHSFGGRIAIKMAIQYPHLIKKLILMDSAGIRRQDKLLAFFAGLGFWKGVPGYKTARQVFYKMRGCTDYCGAKGIMKETFKLVVKEDLRKRLNEIKVDTLLIWGKYDKSTPLKDGKIMDQEIENSKLIIINSGHSPHLVIPDKVKEILFKEL